MRLFNGADGEWVYELAELTRKGATARPVEQRRLQLERTGSPILLFAPLKKGPTELIIQKATELGVAELRPVITERTNRDQVRLDRLALIATEASEQSERLSVPAIRPPAPLREALQPLRGLLFCDEAGDEADRPWGGDKGRAPLASDELAGTSVPEAILIGPEGGFTPEERQMLRDDPRTMPISLGPRILRAETAAMAALTIWQLRFGDL